MSGEMKHTIGERIKMHKWGELTIFMNQGREGRPKCMNKWKPSNTGGRRHRGAQNRPLMYVT